MSVLESMRASLGLLCVLFPVATAPAAPSHPGRVAETVEPSFVWRAAGAGDAYLGTVLPPGEVIVYTAHQNFLSRIYLLDMSGAAVAFYQYDNMFLSDVEVANGEVHVAESFVPVSYRLDLVSGQLDPVIVDLGLIVFWGLAWDGDHFYLKEFNLRRYDAGGSFDGSTSFGEFVNGGAWDGSYYWTLNDSNEINCWDVTQWPAVTQVPQNSFAPPTAACRGLWFDGQYFWSAESLDGSLGWIFRFDHAGAVVDQWLEPAFRGWAACRVGTGVPESYCAGKTNSLGCVPFLTAVGVPSSGGAGAFTIAAHDLVAGQAGFLIYGLRKANLDFHGGKLCVKAPLVRLLPPKVAAATGPPPCAGSLQRDFNKRIQGGGDPSLTTGQAVAAQFFQRDPADPAGFGDGLTDAVRFTIQP